MLQSASITSIRVTIVVPDCAAEPIAVAS